MAGRTSGEDVQQPGGMHNSSSALEIKLEKVLQAGVMAASSGDGEMKKRDRKDPWDERKPIVELTNQ